MKKPIALFGGTFDPIHNGHLHLAEELTRSLDLAEMRFIPCAQNVLKQNAPLASGAQRVAMIKLAIADFALFSVDDYEVTHNQPSYTLNTLLATRQQIGTAQPLCFVMSCDAFEKFDQWHRYQEILDCAHLIVVPRPGYQSQFGPPLQQLLTDHKINQPAQLQQAPAGYIYIQPVQRQWHISGTEIRLLIEAGEQPKEFLSPAVWDFICQQSLYRVTPSLQ